MKFKIKKNERLKLLLVKGKNQNNKPVNPGVTVPKIDESETRLIPIYVTSASISNQK